MSWISGTPGAGLAVLALAGLALGGCGQADTETNKAENEPVKGSEVQTIAAVDHGGWWCTEHGIPEGICARCNAKVAAEYQQKGDWCKEHNRPESQCFLCHPELEGKFAAQYEAKFGQKPPKPEE